jgi:hypothetical protein
MRCLGSTTIKAQIIPARGIEPLMTKEFFDMAYRTAVEEEGLAMVCRRICGLTGFVIPAFRR